MNTAFSLLMALAGSLRSQAPPVSGEAYRVSVNVNLVLLNATVRDRKGGFVSDLQQPDFEVYEDGVRQSIRLFRKEDVPVTIGLVIDHSGSMRPKLAEVSAAARTFVQSSSGEDQMFVLNFNDRVSAGLPAGVRFSNQADELAHAISGTPAGGTTALYDATVDALARLKDGTKAKKALIVISDGGDNGSAHRLAEVLNLAEESSALVYTVGIFDDADPDKNPGVLKKLAQVTGGEAFFPGPSDDLIGVCLRIARDIRNQYTLGFVSSNAAPPGAFRRIKVIARSGKTKLDVRARSGYIAAAP